MKSATITLVAILLLLTFGIISRASTVTTVPAFIYSSISNGRILSSGDIFRQDRLTAGHASIPLGSVVRVTNPVTNRSVDVLVNDRWNGSHSALLLSPSAASVLGLAGTQPVVQFEVLAHPVASNRPVSLVSPQEENASPGLYFLEFASYRSSIQGHLLAKKLTSRGAPTTVVQSPSGLYHVISSGYFTSLEDASAAYHLLARHVGFIPTIKRL